MAKLKWTTAHDNAMGKRIRDAREAKGLSLQAISERLHISKGTAGHWETGERAIKHHDLARLCAELEVSADEILFGVRRWPLPAVDFDLVSDLEPIDLGRLEGAILQRASDLGLQICRAPTAGSLNADADAFALLGGPGPKEGLAEGQGRHGAQDQSSRRERRRA